jgi:hypothetical protein
LLGDKQIWLFILLLNRTLRCSLPVVGTGLNFKPIDCHPQLLHSGSLSESKTLAEFPNSIELGKLLAVAASAHLREAESC